MALYIPHSIFHLARLLCVRPETFGPYYVNIAVCFEIHTKHVNALCGQKAELFDTKTGGTPSHPTSGVVHLDAMTSS